MALGSAALVAAAVTLSLTVFEDAFLRAFGNPSTVAEPPWLPNEIVLTKADRARAASGLVLKAEPLACRPRDVLVSVVNVSGEPVPVDARQLVTGQGVSAAIIDTAGRAHATGLAPAYRPPGGAESGLDVVALGPEESFSAVVRVEHPADAPRLTLRAPPYTIDRFEIAYTTREPKRTGGPAWWSGRLVSNGFDFRSSRSMPTLKRYAHGRYPRADFNRRILPFQVRDELRTDVGLRLAVWRQLQAMRYALPAAWLEEAALRVADDPSPHVRAEAAPFPATWSRLLLDPDAAVRGAALREAAEGREFRGRQQPELTPLFVQWLRTGTPDKQVLALEGIARHGFGESGLTRQYAETIRAASQAADPRVRATAERHFGRLLKQ